MSVLRCLMLFALFHRVLQSIEIIHNSLANHVFGKLIMKRGPCRICITLDPRLPFPDSVGEIFPGPATTQKVYQGIEWSSQLAGLQSLTVLCVLIRGITITLTDDWQSRRLAALSPIMLRNSLMTEGKIRHISVLGIWWLTKIMFQLLNTTVT